MRNENRTSEEAHVSEHDAEPAVPWQERRVGLLPQSAHSFKQLPEAEEFNHGHGHHGGHVSSAVARHLCREASLAEAWLFCDVVGVL